MIGFLKMRQTSAADVTAVRAREEAAQEVECEGMAVYFTAGGEEFGVVGHDFRRAGPFGTGVMQERGTGFLGEVAQVHTEHAAPRSAQAAFEFAEVCERFPGGDEAEAAVFGV